MKERGNRLLKVLDKYVGIPLIMVFGAFRIKRRFDIHSVQPDDLRFIFLKTAALGDTVLLSAIAREVKYSYPHASITLVVSKGNAPIVPLLEGIDEVVLFDMSAPITSLRAIAKLKKAHVLLDFAPWARINSLIAYCAVSRLKIGFTRKRTFRHYVFDKTVEHSDELHEIDNYRNLLRCVPLEIAGYLPSLRLERAIIDRAEQVLKDSKCNVVFHPFPGGFKKELKEWPRENWVDLGRRLIGLGCRIYISGDKNDAPTADAIQRELGERCVVLCGNFSLAEVAGILYKSSLLITVNTGIMHMGAALNTAIIALHGPTSPRRWGPLNKNSIVVKPAVPCAPCISLGFEYGCSGGGCMNTITVEEVFLAADRILQKADTA